MSARRKKPPPPRFVTEWRAAHHTGAIPLTLPPGAFSWVVRQTGETWELVLRFAQAAVAFGPGATAQLHGHGASGPASSAPVEAAGDDELTATFPLSEAMGGEYRVAVVDPAGPVYALDGALAVSGPGAHGADHEAHERHARHESWFVKALLATLAGLMLSGLITLMIIALSAVGFAPARVLERTGVDFGMQLYVYLIEPLAPPKSNQEYAFIDVDRDACMAFSNQDGAACDSRTPVPPALVQDFVRAAREAGAKVVLIDVAPPAKPEDRKALYTALARPDGPWVIVPMYGRPGDDALGLSLNGDPVQDIFPSRAQGKLRMAVAGTIDNDGDGIIRVYPTQFQVTEPGGRVDWFPSTPLLAADLASPDKARQTDCKFYGQGCAPGQSAAGGGKASDDQGDPARYITGIFFSLPSLAVRQGRAQVNLERMYSRYYERYLASGLMEHGRFDPPADLLKDKILIISTSRKQGFDWQVTPLGPMTGSEVVLNALRTFHDYAPLDRPLSKAPVDQKFSIGMKDFTTRFTGAAAGAFFMLAAWSLYHRLEALVPHHARRGPGEDPHSEASRLGRMFRALPRNVVRLVIVFIGLAFAASVEIYLNAHELDEIASRANGAQEFGHPIDVLAPLVALGLEAYADIAKGTLAFFEALLAPIVHSVERLFLGVFGLFLRVGGKRT